MSAPRIRVVLIEDDRAVCKRIARLIDGSEDVVLAATFHDAESALAASFEADIAIVDLGLPGMTGIELIARLRTERPDLDAIVLTTAEDDASVFDALRAGASGYLVKNDGLEILQESLAVLLRGGSPMSPVIARRVIDGLRGGASTTPSDPGPLTARESEVLALLARGSSYAAIGRELGIGTGTVQSHIKQIYRKLGIHSRSEAVREAYRRRLHIP